MRHFRTGGKLEYKDSFTKIDSSDTNQSLIVEQRHYVHGKCYTFSPSEDMKKRGMVYIQAKL